MSAVCEAVVSKPCCCIEAANDRMDAKCGNKGAIEIAYVGVGGNGAGWLGPRRDASAIAMVAARGNAKIDIMRAKCA